MRYNINIAGAMTPTEQEMALEINSSFEAVELDIDSAEELGLRPSSIDSLIFERHIPQMSPSFLISSYSQSIPVGVLSYTLDLIPDDIANLNVQGYVVTSSIPLASNEVQLNGRELVFFSPTPSQIEATCNGYLPDTYSVNLSETYTVPDIKDVLLNYIAKPLISEVGTLTYSMICEETRKIKGLSGSTLLPVPYILPDLVTSNIQANGDLDISFVDLYMLDVDNKLTKVKIESFNIVSSNSFIFTSVAAIDLSATYVCVFAGKSLEEKIDLLYSIIKEHNHNPNSFNKRIDHLSLKSESSYNYHPQYLLRDGYNSSTGENGFNGKLFISSKDTFNNGSNNLDSSYPIIFNSSNTGSILYRDHLENILTVDGLEHNGFSIQTLRANENTKKLLVLNGLVISEMEATGIGKYKIESDLPLYFIAQTILNDAHIKKATMEDGGNLNLWGVSIKQNLAKTEVEIDAVTPLVLKGNIKYSSGTFSSIAVQTLDIPTGGQISFNSEEITSTINGPSFSAILFDEYVKVKSVSKFYSDPTPSSNFLSIESDGEVLLLRRIDKVNPVVIDGETYSFGNTVPGAKRIDDITEYPKQKLRARSVTVDGSDYTSREGITFGGIAKVYSSENDESCSIKALVIQAPKVVLLKEGTGTGCGEEFSDIIAGNIKSSTITASSITSSGFIDGKTVSGENATFTGELKVLNLLTSSLSASSATIKTSLEAGETRVSKLTSTGEISTSSNISCSNLSVSGIDSKNIKSESLSTTKFISTSIITEGVKADELLAVSANISNGIISDLKTSNLMSSSIEANSMSARILNVTSSISSLLVNAENIASSGNITSQGQISSETLRVASEASISGGLSVSGDTQISTLTASSIKANAGIETINMSTGSLKVSGGITSEAISCSGTISAKKISVEEDLSLKTITAESLNLSKGIYGQYASLQIKEVNISGSITSTGTEINNIHNGTIFHDKVIIKGSTVAKDGLFSTLDIGTEEEKISIRSSRLTIPENGKITVNFIDGNSKVDTVGLSELTSIVSGRLVQSVSTSSFSEVKNAHISGILYNDSSAIFAGDVYLKKLIYIGNDSSVDIISRGALYG